MECQCIIRVGQRRGFFQCIFFMQLSQIFGLIAVRLSLDLWLNPPKSIVQLVKNCILALVSLDFLASWGLKMSLYAKKSKFHLKQWFLYEEPKFIRKVEIEYIFFIFILLKKIRLRVTEKLWCRNRKIMVTKNDVFFIVLAAANDK